jgi:hypothetical protein
MLCSVNPYLRPILGVRAHRAEAKIGDHTIIVLIEFDGHGAAFSILAFPYFASKINVLVLGPKFLLILN